MPKIDDGRKICKDCEPEVASAAEVTPVEESTPAPISTALKVEGADKLRELLGLGSEWEFGYQVSYSLGKWRFDLLVKNSVDTEQRAKVLCGIIG